MNEEKQIYKNIVVAYKARPIGDHKAIDTLIEISGNIEDVTKDLNLKGIEEFMAKEAKRITSGLQNSLPQGVFYRITAEMIRRTADLYIGRVPI